MTPQHPNKNIKKFLFASLLACIFMSGCQNSKNYEGNIERRIKLATLNDITIDSLISKYPDLEFKEEKNGIREYLRKATINETEGDLKIFSRNDTILEISFVSNTIWMGNVDLAYSIFEISEKDYRQWVNSAFDYYSIPNQLDFFENTYSHLEENIVHEAEVGDINMLTVKTGVFLKYKIYNNLKKGTKPITY